MDETKGQGAVLPAAAVPAPSHDVKTLSERTAVIRSIRIGS